LYNAAGVLSVLLSPKVFVLYILSLFFFSLLIFFHASVMNRSLRIGLLSVAASFVMLTGYGAGMIRNFISRKILRSHRESEKPEITKE